MPGTYGHLSIGRLWWFPSNNHRGRAQRAHLDITWCTFHFCRRRRGREKWEMGYISIVMTKVGHITMAGWLACTADMCVCMLVCKYGLAKRISKMHWPYENSLVTGFGILEDYLLGLWLAVATPELY